MAGLTELAAGLERWRGKVALVTGASAGIGRTIAGSLAASGLKVAGTARRVERLQALQAEIEGAGGSFLPLAADLEQPEAIAALFGELRDAWGGVDVLINNAGLGRRLALQEGDPLWWQKMLDVNVRAVALCTREALRDLQGKPDAAVINIASLASYRVPLAPDEAFYAATKHALRVITEGLRYELSGQRSPIKVGSISPGLVASEFQDVAYQEVGALEKRAAYRPLDPADIATTVLTMLAMPRHVQISDVLLRSVESPT